MRIEFCFLYFSEQSWRERCVFAHCVAVFIIINSSNIIWFICLTATYDDCYFCLYCTRSANTPSFLKLCLDYYCGVFLCFVLTIWGRKIQYIQWESGQCHGFAQAFTPVVWMYFCEHIFCKHTNHLSRVYHVK